MAYTAIVRSIKFEPSSVAGSVEATAIVLCVDDGADKKNAAESVIITVTIDLTNLVTTPRQQMADAIRAQATLLGMTLKSGLVIMLDLLGG